MDGRRSRAAGAVTLLLLSLLLVGSCSADDTIQIFAASSLQDVIPEIIDGYPKTGDAPKIEIVYGGSQTLATQIELGAATAIFLSANSIQVDRLESHGLVKERMPLATNRLVIAVPNDSSLADITGLTADGIRLAIGAVDVPVGALTQRVFASLDKSMQLQIRQNVVTEDPNVRLVLSRVQIGEVDAAFVYRSDVIAVDDLRAIEIPIDVQNIYTGALIKRAPVSATELFAFISSEVNSSIWNEEGFETVSSQ